MTNQQGAPEALRLRNYVERRKRAKQLDVNKVHAFDTGCDTEAELLLSDVETLLSLVEAQQPASKEQTMTEPTELLPCPFCGAGESQIHVNKGTWNGRGYGEPVSVEVRHWCADVPGQPSRMISRAGRDEASAIAAWNTRTTTQPQAGAVPLTDDQLAEMMRETWGCASIAPRHAMKFARAIEVAHGIGIKGGQHG